jgi:SagB-type dehydrogenase family enzyme
MLSSSWATRVGRDLRLQAEDRLCELYHENSKLAAPSAWRYLDAQSALTSQDLFLMSRGFRQFPDFPRVPLPELSRSDALIQEVMLRRRSVRMSGEAVRLEELSTLLQQALGATAVVENPDVAFAQILRAWPSAGGLYPLDTYVIASRVEGLERALYHYNVPSIALERLPGRDIQAILGDGFFGQDFVVDAALVIVLVATFERTIAKYGERGYRLVLLDAGHAGQNLLLTAEQLGLNSCAIGGFCDDSLSTDLGIDGVSEAVVLAVVLGKRP